MRLIISAIIMLMSLPISSQAADFTRFQTQEIDPHAGQVCYAVTVADLNGDQKPDVVAVTEDAVVWYENPSWQKHDIIRKATARDNVCIQAHDIDGDGRIDLALGAGWRRPDTKNPSTLQWLGRDALGNVADSSHSVPGAHSPPPAPGATSREREEAIGGCSFARARHEGSKLG